MMMHHATMVMVMHHVTMVMVAAHTGFGRTAHRQGQDSSDRSSNKQFLHHKNSPWFEQPREICHDLDERMLNGSSFFLQLNFDKGIFKIVNVDDVMLDTL